MLFGSLTGLRVVDISHIGAGPMCGMYLGDLGADVVKIESPDGDLGRKLGPPWDGIDSTVYTSFNRNKRSLCVDLKRPEGVLAMRRILDRADVVIESFRPTVMERLGLGYEAVRKSNASVIYCSVSAYGQSGPFSERPGVDGILQAASGLMSLIGDERGEPCKVQSPVVDIATGTNATLAVLAALYDRQRSGKGAHLDASLFASALSLQQASITGYLADGNAPTKLGSAAPYSAPNEAYPTADGYIMVAAYTPQRWNVLCEILGAPELARDERFSASPARVANRAALRATLSELFRRETTSSWIVKLENADVLCSAVADYSQLTAHPQVKHAGMLAESLPDAAGRTHRFPAFPVRDSTTTPTYKAPPSLGGDTQVVLLEAGFSANEISSLIACGAVVAPTLATEVN
jgi:crotonobetainyl-CoA:carnitine CoA-transferase CaiB-like acyl-CoA transferase